MPRSRALLLLVLCSHLLLCCCHCCRVTPLLLHHHRQVGLRHVARCSHLPHAQLRTLHARVHAGATLHACCAYSACLHQLHLRQLLLLLLLLAGQCMLLLLSIAEACMVRQCKQRSSNVNGPPKRSRTDTGNSAVPIWLRQHPCKASAHSYPCLHSQPVTPQLQCNHGALQRYPAQQHPL
jgi:hypothetical protein